MKCGILSTKTSCPNHTIRLYINKASLHNVCSYQQVLFNHITEKQVLQDMRLLPPHYCRFVYLPLMQGNLITLLLSVSGFRKVMDSKLLLLKELQTESLLFECGLNRATFLQESFIAVKKHM